MLSERQNQLTERLEKVKRNKEKILEDREEILLDIEAKKNQIAKEIATQREKRDNLISGLNKQIEEKNEQIIAEIEYDNKGNFLNVGSFSAAIMDSAAVLKICSHWLQK